jgi:hypothetical protein
MKYQNTSRVLCLGFHALIVAVFGALGIYFTFFVTPLYFTVYQTYFITLTAAFNLYLELGVLGMALFTISIYGLIQGIKAVLTPSDDAPVVKSFTAFIVEGYVASLFFLANGLVFFDLTSGSSGNLAFVIIMAIIFAILLLIATNIPMVRLYDGKNQNPLLAGLSLGGAVTFVYLALSYILALIGSASHSAEYYTNIINPSLLGLFFASLIIAGLLIASAVLILKSGDKKKKVNIAGYLVGGSVLVLAGMFIGTGIVDLIQSDSNVHLEGIALKYTGVAYPIMSLVVGALLFVGGIAFVIINSKEPAPKKVAKVD